MSPGDRTPAEFSVFGLLPGRLPSGPLLDATREVINQRLFGIAAIDEEVPIPLVVDDGPGVRIVVRRVPDFGAVEVKVLVVAGFEAKWPNLGSEGKFVN